MRPGLRRVSPLGGRVLALEQGEARTLGRRDTRVQVLQHAADAALVVVSVEPEPARGAGGREQAVAALPGTQQLGADAHAAAQLADAQMARGVWFSLHLMCTLQTLYENLTVSPYLCTLPGQTLNKETSMKNALVTAIAGLALLATAGGASAAPTGQVTAAKGNIVQTAVGAGQFTTLVSLVKKAGLVGALSGKGPLTVFAPTDAAFAKVPKATLTALGKDKAKLKRVLLYHVVAGKVTAAHVVKLRSAKTLEGSSVAIRVSGGKVFAGGAQIVKADVAASNGVIHAIDKVLIPAM